MGGRVGDVTAERRPAGARFVGAPSAGAPFAGAPSAAAPLAGGDPLAGLLAALGRPFAFAGLFDAIPDTVFFIKDGAGRYVVANQVLAARTGFGRKEALVGLGAEAVFPGALGRRIAAQDRAVLGQGRGLKGELELHLYPGGREGWCLTWKEPLRAPDGRVVGLVGLSRDLPREGRPAGGGAGPADAAMAALSRALRLVQERPGAVGRVAELARAAGMSPARLDGRLRALFGLSAGQYLTRLRIAHAGEQLRATTLPIAAVALGCGYADQTALTRQFTKVTGLSPGAYRKRHRDGTA